MNLLGEGDVNEYTNECNVILYNAHMLFLDLEHFYKRPSSSLHIRSVILFFARHTCNMIRICMLFPFISVYFCKNRKIHLLHPSTYVNIHVCHISLQNASNPLKKGQNFECSIEYICMLVFF